MQVVKGKNHGYGLPADIWSLGCTVLEMLTGQVPYAHLEHVCVKFTPFLIYITILVQVNYVQYSVFVYCCNLHHQI